MFKKLTISSILSYFPMHRHITLLIFACAFTCQLTLLPLPTALATTNTSQDSTSFRNPFLPYTTSGSITTQRHFSKSPAELPPSGKDVTPSTANPSAAFPQHLPQETDSYFIIPLNYASAENISKTLKGVGFSHITIDQTTNSLVYKGTEQGKIDLQALVQKLDKATPQVTLEAKIIAISHENSKELGINWQWDTIPQRSTKNDNSNSSNTSNSDSDDFGANWKIWHGYGIPFQATLNALISQGKAKILATPHIITIPGKEASIFIGDHIPVQTEKHTSSSTYTATEYVDAGIKLQYTPIISQDSRMVTAAVHTEVSTPTLVSEIKNYRVTSRTADTNVRMYSGETLVIGGLINEEEQKTLQQIPLLSKIPLLGELFKNRTTKRSKVEVMMLLTPYITEAGHSPAIYEDHSKEMLSRKVVG